MTEPTPVTPIDATGSQVSDRLGATVVEVPPALLDRLMGTGAQVLLDDEARATTRSFIGDNSRRVAHA